MVCLQYARHANLSHTLTFIIANSDLPDHVPLDWFYGAPPHSAFVIRCMYGPAAHEMWYNGLAAVWLAGAEGICRRL